MIRLAVPVEGQTEEEFVNSLLADHLRSRQVAPTPILLGRARRPGVGGGNVSAPRLALEMAHLYHSFDVVTSLVDFYGFRHKGGRTVEELETHLGCAVRARVGRRWHQAKVLPYVQKHEFESLLFADVTAFTAIAGVHEESINRLEYVRSRFHTPEEIDDGPETAPSKRIVGVLPSYRKSLHGPRVAKRMGIGTIRKECPRFDQWLRRLESIGNQFDLQRIALARLSSTTFEPGCAKRHGGRRKHDD